VPFSQSVKEEALVRSRRCCCVCQEFAGLSTEVHHIIHRSEGGSDDLDNAIVLCRRCHAEVGQYNSRHPVGNKYSPEELRRLRDQWWTWCEKNPAVPLPKYPVSVSPGSVTLFIRGEKVRFKVYNETKEVYYQVWIKITIDMPNILPEHVGIEMVNPKTEVTGTAGPVAVSGDIMGIDGTDQAGKKAVCILLGSLDPHEVCTFLLTNNLPQEIAKATPLRLNMSVWGFSTTPGTMIQNEKRVAFRFSAPETFGMDAIYFLMRRT